MERVGYRQGVWGWFQCRASSFAHRQTDRRTDRQRAIARRAELYGIER